MTASKRTAPRTAASAPASSPKAKSIPMRQARRVAKLAVAPVVMLQVAIAEAASLPAARSILSRLGGKVVRLKQTLAGPTLR